MTKEIWVVFRLYSFSGVTKWVAEHVEDSKELADKWARTESTNWRISEKKFRVRHFVEVQEDES